MSVNHNVVIGYGVRVPREVLRSYQNAIDPDDEFFISELLDELLSDFPLIDYIRAGSYYDNLPTQYALVIAKTAESHDDLSGFLDLEHAVITAEEKYQLRAAWWQLVFAELDLPEPGWHVGGLWS